MSKRKDGASRSKGGWQDAGGGFGSNPFAEALGGLASEPAPPAAAEPASAPPPKAAALTPRRAVVRLEKKGRGGKQVTVVSHLEGLDAAALEAWCVSLRQGLGCGGAVEDDTLVLQGDQRQRVARWLEGRGVGRVTVA